MNALLTHLWSSTLLLAIVLVLARVLPLTARTRFALLFCGLLKFLVPAAVVLAPLRAMGIDVANLGRRSASIISMQWLEAPASITPLAAQSAQRWPQALLLAWLASAAVLALAWALARHRLVTSALKAASPASEREREALAAARRRLLLAASIDVTR